MREIEVFKACVYNFIIIKGYYIIKLFKVAVS